MKNTLSLLLALSLLLPPLRGIARAGAGEGGGNGISRAERLEPPAARLERAIRDLPEEFAAPPSRPGTDLERVLGDLRALSDSARRGEREPLSAALDQLADDYGWDAAAKDRVLRHYLALFPGSAPGAPAAGGGETRRPSRPSTVGPDAGRLRDSVAAARPEAALGAPSDDGSRVAFAPAPDFGSGRWGQLPLREEHLVDHPRGGEPTEGRFRDATIPSAGGGEPIRGRLIETGYEEGRRRAHFISADGSTVELALYPSAGAESSGRVRLFSPADPSLRAGIMAQVPEGGALLVDGERFTRQGALLEGRRSTPRGDFTGTFVFDEASLQSFPFNGTLAGRGADGRADGSYLLYRGGRIVAYQDPAGTRYDAETITVQSAGYAGHSFNTVAMRAAGDGPAGYLPILVDREGRPATRESGECFLYTDHQGRLLPGRPIRVVTPEFLRIPRDAADLARFNAYGSLSNLAYVELHPDGVERAFFRRDGKIAKVNEYRGNKLLRSFDPESGAILFYDAHPTETIGRQSGERLPIASEDTPAGRRVYFMTYGLAVERGRVRPTREGMLLETALYDAEGRELERRLVADRIELGDTGAIRSARPASGDLAAFRAEHAARLADWYSVYEPDARERLEQAAELLGTVAQPFAELGQAALGTLAAAAAYSPLMVGASYLMAGDLSASHAMARSGVDTVLATGWSRIPTDILYGPGASAELRRDLDRAMGIRPGAHGQLIATTAAGQVQLDKMAELLYQHRRRLDPAATRSGFVAAADHELANSLMNIETSTALMRRSADAAASPAGRGAWLAAEGATRAVERGVEMMMLGGPLRAQGAALDRLVRGAAAVENGALRAAAVGGASGLRFAVHGGQAGIFGWGMLDTVIRRHTENPLRDPADANHMLTVSELGGAVLGGAGLRRPGPAEEPVRAPAARESAGRERPAPAADLGAAETGTPAAGEPRVPSAGAAGRPLQQILDEEFSFTNRIRLNQLRAGLVSGRGFWRGPRAASAYDATHFRRAGEMARGERALPEGIELPRAEVPDQGPTNHCGLHALANQHRAHGDALGVAQIQALLRADPSLAAVGPKLGAWLNDAISAKGLSPTELLQVSRIVAMARGRGVEIVPPSRLLAQLETARAGELPPSVRGASVGLFTGRGLHAVFVEAVEADAAGNRWVVYRESSGGGRAALPFDSFARALRTGGIQDTAARPAPEVYAAWRRGLDVWARELAGKYDPRTPVGAQVAFVGFERHLRRELALDFRSARRGTDAAGMRRLLEEYIAGERVHRSIAKSLRRELERRLAGEAAAGDLGAGGPLGRHQEIQLLDRDGNTLGELDAVDAAARVIYEDKSARGLLTPNPSGRIGSTPEQWAAKQILAKTRVRLDNWGSVERTAPGEGGARGVLDFAEFSGFRDYRFRIEGDRPDLRAAVDAALSDLSAEYPGWSFSAEYGGRP